MSETALARRVLAKYCVGLGLDLGFGGDRITPDALSWDQRTPYTNVGGDVQVFQGDANDLSIFCDGVLDYCYSSHFLEDDDYAQLAKTLKEWRRVLKVGGLLITCCPDQQVYLRQCRLDSSLPNQAHKEATFSLDTFNQVARSVGDWETVYENPLTDSYSFHSVLRKV